MKSMLPAAITRLFGSSKDKGFVGLAIGTNALNAIIMSKSETGYTLDKSIKVPLSSEEALPAVLAGMIKEHDLADFTTSIVLPANKTQSSQIEHDELPDANPQDALPWKMKDLINIPPQDMVCDYIDMPLQPFGQSAKAQVFATSREYLVKITEPFHEAGATINQILTEQFAIAALQTTKEAAQLVFLQHEGADAILLILKNQQICFARKIRGTDALVKMSPEELQMGATDNVAIEIQRSIDYYESQLKQPPIKNVFLAIDGANGPYIVQALNQALPLKTVEFPFEDLIGEKQVPLSHIPALGAAFAAASSQSAEAS